MSDKPIQVGDLVVVVRGAPCCGCVDALGTVCAVIEIAQGIGRCHGCHTRYSGLFYRLGTPNRGRFYRDMLIRLDPDALADTIHTDEAATA